ncbi:ADP-ribosyl cyclase/cyclic ADP-ribose hydrolase 1 [Ctenodactylus gundi]
MACCSRRVQIGLGLLVVLAAAVVVVVVVVKGPLAAERLAWEGEGSTRHFSDIVLGRCFVYTQVLRPELRNEDCHKILKVFKNAFISKNPCNITKEDYQPLVNLVTQTIPCNKSLFWSKSKDLAHLYTSIQKGMFTLEDTLLGYLADDLRWCGDPSNYEMNDDSCPHYKECPNNPSSVFWKVVSQKFAEAACGVVQVMLNGSLSQPFYRHSTFGSVEVFNLDPKKVHTLQAWVMHDIEGTYRDSCSGSSISDLKLIVNNRNIKFTCQNNYR